MIAAAILTALAVPSVLAVAVPLPVGAAATRPAPAGEERPFGKFRAQVDGLLAPADVVVAADGTIWIVEEDAHRVTALDATGAGRASFGGLGAGPGELLFPRGLALGPEGRVFVADSGNHRIQVFEASGAPVRAWGRLGHGAGELHTPAGIDVLEDLVAVADERNDRVVLFDREGALVRVLGGKAPGAGLLRRPVDVAFGPDDTLYVASGDSDRVERFDLDGRHLDGWGGWGGYEGQLDGPSGLAVAGGRVHVADRGNHRIQIFDLEGRWITSWGVHAILPREAGGKLHYPSRIAITPGGDGCVVAETFEDRLQLFDRYPEGEVAPMPLLGPKEGGSTHYGREVDASGDLLIVPAPETHAVLVFDTTPADTPILTTTLGGHGAGWGRFVRPSGVDVSLVDVAGEERWTALVADRGNRRLQSFVLDHAASDPLGYRPDLGRFALGLDLARLGDPVAGVALDWVIEPAALVRDEDDHVWVCDPRNARVVVFDERLAPRLVFGAPGTALGELREPTDLALAPGRCYVVDAHNHRVQVFDREGVALFAFGAPGGGDGEFLVPRGVHVDADGTVFVTDSRRHDVQEFEADGRFVRAWGGPGLERARMFRPAGVVRDAEGRLVVIDHGNHRAQRFDLTGEFLDAFGSRWFVQPTR